jgi:molecular chaperone GrpE
VTYETPEQRPAPAPEPGDDGFRDEAVVDGGQGEGRDPAPDLELERAVAERDEYLHALQRLKAEFDNYRKRTERERQAMAAGAARDVVRGLLPVMDNLERAVAALGEHGDQIVAGVEMVRGQLASVLTGHGVEEIAAMGEEFDPTVHEAIAQLPVHGHAPGTVVEVVEKGYRHSEHVLRPTKVVVASEPPAADGPPAGETR